METGSISKWNLKEGDKYEVGTAICEVETDKATMSFDATEDGYVARILVGTGDVKVGDPIMVTVEEESFLAAFKGFQLSAAATTAAPAAAPATPTPTAAPTTPAAVPAPAAAAPVVAAAAPVAAPSSSSSSGDRLFASPLARKLAREAGISLSDVAAALQVGSGPQGRFVAADVLRAASMPRTAATATTTAATTTTAAAPAAAGKANAPVAVAAAGGGGAAGVYSDFGLSEQALSLAALQTRTKLTVPHYYLSVELNLSKLMKLRAELNGHSAAGSSSGSGKGAVVGGGGLTVLDFLVKASALAMKQVPDVNGAWMDTFVRRYDQVDINLVMGAGSFLATPVLRDVSSRGLSALSQEIVALEDSLFSEEGAAVSAEKMALGTFSIHNLGMYGVKAASPIVLTPQACALCLGAITDSVIPASTATATTTGQDWEVAPTMVATLSCDHRVVDGAVGAQWLAAFKQLVENPLTMLL